MLTKKDYIARVLEIITEELITDDNVMLPYMSRSDIVAEMKRDLIIGANQCSIKDFTNVNASFNRFGFSGFVKDGQFIYSYGPITYVSV